MGGITQYLYVDSNNVVDIVLHSGSDSPSALPQLSSSLPSFKEM